MKKSLIFLIIFTIVLAIALTLLYIYPKSMGLISSFEKNDELTQKIKETKESQEKIRPLLANEEELRTNLEKINKFLPQKEEIPAFLIQVEAAASSSGNNLLEINLPETKAGSTTKQSPTKSDGKGSNREGPKPETKNFQSKALALQNNPNNISPIEFEIKIEGRYIALLNFLRNLENLLRFNVVSSLETQKKEKGEILTSTIKGQVFYRK